MSNLARSPPWVAHGTATEDRRSWSWNYGKVLPAQGFDVCTVTLPDRALGDIQVAAEYVVHAVRAMSAASGDMVQLAPLPAQRRRAAAQALCGMTEGSDPSATPAT